VLTEYDRLLLSCSGWSPPVGERRRQEEIAYLMSDSPRRYVFRLGDGTTVEAVAATEVCALGVLHAEHPDARARLLGSILVSRLGGRPDRQLRAAKLRAMGLDVLVGT
jgi:hypothetical protein